MDVKAVRVWLGEVGSVAGRVASSGPWCPRRGSGMTRAIKGPAVLLWARFCGRGEGQVEGMSGWKSEILRI